MNSNVNTTLTLRYLPYFIIVAFAIFATCMVIEIHDINAELEAFKNMVVEFKLAEIRK